MTKQSGRIVEGKVLSVAEGFVPGPSGGKIPVTKYTLSVSKSMKGKGKSGAKIVVKHLRLSGVSLMTGEGGGERYEFPTYKVGEHLILFLTHESSLGLSSPIGLQQGVFQVQKDKDGRPTHAVNGVDNAGLYDSADEGAPTAGQDHTRKEETGFSIHRKKGPIPYDNFISEVNGFSGLE